MRRKYETRNKLAQKFIRGYVYRPGEVGMQRERDEDGSLLLKAA